MTRNDYGQAYIKGFERTVRFLISRGAQRDGAREAAQAGWARGWERLNQLRNEETVLPWVNAIALNADRGLLRKEAHHQPLRELTTKAGIDVAKIDVSRVLRECRPNER